MREKLQAKIGKAFNGKLADAVTHFAASYTLTIDYDPITEKRTTDTFTYSGRGVLADYRIDRIDGVNILSGDLELVALTNEVTDKPAVGHHLTAPDLLSGKPQRYTVVRVETDPTRSVYSIQLRRV